MKPEDLLQQYSFAEGFIEAIDVGKSERSLTIFFEAVPYGKGHKKDRATSRAKNPPKRTLYSAEDLCNGQLSLFGCEFEVFELGQAKNTPGNKVKFEASEAVEFFNLTKAGNKNKLELVAGDIRVNCFFVDMKFDEKPVER
jgi:hypothetical protein